MNELIAVHAPATRLAEVEGLELMLLSVELWTQSVFVHLAATETPLTDRLSAEQTAELERWALDPTRTDMPEVPGAALSRLELTLTDDAGTRYWPASSSAGGSGTEWRAMYQLEPRVPAGASRLTIAIGEDHVDVPL
jgi:hypothetical protein